MVEHKILIVEDDENVSTVLSKNLERRNYEVIRAADGYGALYKYMKEKPAMIILDVTLPKLNGYEVCREIRRVQNDTVTPIIMVTGHADDYARIKGKVVGADLYLTKPIELSKLMEEIRNLAVKI